MLEATQPASCMQTCSPQDLTIPRSPEVCPYAQTGGGSAIHWRAGLEATFSAGLHCSTPSLFGNTHLHCTQNRPLQSHIWQTSTEHPPIASYCSENTSEHHIFIVPGFLEMLDFGQDFPRLSGKTVTTLTDAKK